jgi:hypothetical protein
MAVSQEEEMAKIRAARNRLLLLVHPDKAKCPGGHEAGVRVNEVRTCSKGRAWSEAGQHLMHSQSSVPISTAEQGMMLDSTYAGCKRMLGSLSPCKLTS